jgi:hypothetical protein
MKKKFTVGANEYEILVQLNHFTGTDFCHRVICSGPSGYSHERYCESWDLAGCVSRIEARTRYEHKTKSELEQILLDNGFTHESV